MAMNLRSSRLKLDQLPHPVLLVVVSQFEKIQDIISKERISTGFQRAVDTILMKKKELIVRVLWRQTSNPTILLNLVKRMPKLVTINSVSGFGNYKMFASALAAINQNIQKLMPHPELALLYLECVKKLNPDYDAANYKEVFNPDCRYLIEDCLKKYPDWKFKVQTLGSKLEECSHKHLISSLNLYSDDMINEPLPSVEKLELVVLNPDHNLSQIFRFLPNTKSFHLRTGVQFDMKKFHQILDSVDNRFLEHLCITCDSKPDANFTPRIQTFIRSKPLKSVSITYHEEDRELFLQLVNMLINITNVHDHHLKEINTCDGTRRNEQKLVVKDTVLRYKVSSKEEFEDINFLDQVLNSYPKVKNIEITMRYPISNLNDFINCCEEFADANHKRVIKLTVMHQKISGKIASNFMF